MHNISQELGISWKIFFCNILNGDIYIDVLITEPFQICLAVSQALGESAVQSIFVHVLREVGELV